MRALDAGSWFGADFAGEPIPTLAEFLDELAPTNSRALIELKGSWSDEQVAGAVDMLAERYLVDRVAFESFELENLERLAAARPRVRAGDAHARLGPSQPRYRSRAQRLRDRGEEQGVRRDFGLVEDARVLGIGTMVYTLNTEKQWATGALARELTSSSRTIL